MSDPDMSVLSHYLRHAHNQLKERIVQGKMLSSKVWLSQYLMDEPSFSLGLTQDEQVQGEVNIMAPEVDPGEPMSENNVDDNIEEEQVSRKSKRQKTVPSSLVDDYQCGPHILSQIVDILIRVLCSDILHQLPPEGPRSADFLDTKFVAGIIKTYPKFLKSKKKEPFVFPKVLRDIFPTKDAAKVHPTWYYFPFNIAKKHWIGICFDAGSGIVIVLDCDTSKYKHASLEKYITPIVQMLPYVARYACQPIGPDPVIQCYDVGRPKSVAQIKNPADSGLMAVLLMATHAMYGIELCNNINNDILEKEGKCAAILAYEFKEHL
ncbi:hypothetical protein F2Q70_00042767 [Brassica cretica]|uniref:Ubiquitin-like protease family profile domain-containing protein n=1 Tax=Brassica cretica TaxID=69181 RepID=A0A8S9KLF4_BRACR|nr:hypothetical protein F2Q70_00042767 [Brassica cretica]